MGAYLPEKLDIVQVCEPLRVVYHKSLSFTKINKTAHLLFEAVTVVLNRLRRHHLAHVRPSGRIADHARAAANQGNRLISSHLEPLHQAERHEVAHMEAVCRRVKSDIKGSLSVVYHLPDLFFVRHLGDQSAGYQFFINFHVYLSP